ncbi:MAG: hypothetical protein ACR2KL_10815 [Nocardioidaceae bacterium]
MDESAKERFESWWVGLAPEQRQQLLRLHAGDPVPSELHLALTKVMGTAAVSFLPSQPDSFTVSQTTGDFLDAKRESEQAE